MEKTILPKDSIVKKYQDFVGDLKETCLSTSEKSDSNEKLENLILNLKEIRLLITNIENQVFSFFNFVLFYYKNIVGEMMEKDFNEIFGKVVFLSETIKNEERFWLFFYQTLTNLITNSPPNKVNFFGVKYHYDKDMDY